MNVGISLRRAHIRNNAYYCSESKLFRLRLLYWLEVGFRRGRECLDSYGMFVFLAVKPFTNPLLWQGHCDPPGIVQLLLVWGHDKVDEPRIGLACHNTNA
jgi:hypothetical protein